VDLETDLTWRPLERAAVGRWSELLTAIEAEDSEDELFAEDDLLEEFGDPYIDFPRGSIGGYDGQTMVAYGLLRARTSAPTVHNMRFRGGVHPLYRGRGIGSQVLAWAEQAAPTFHEAVFPGKELALVGRCLTRDSAANRLFAGRGYRAIRWFHGMTCDFSAAALPAVEAEGVRIAGFTRASARDALLVRNDAFRDHWDSSELSSADWARFLAYQAFRPAFSFVAYAGTEPVGMIIGQEYDAYTEATGIRDLYIALVGTRRTWRGRGVGTALLASAVNAARADGCTSATLSVDADSPTGAVGIYQRAGFIIGDTFVELVKSLAGGH
jgi:ribosomal protein S18 acetylase RimI-like enzyme